MSKKSLFSVYIEYKTIGSEYLIADRIFAYAFNECHAFNIVYRKLQTEYNIVPIEYVYHKVLRVYNFVV